MYAQNERIFHLMSGSELVNKHSEVKEGGCFYINVVVFVLYFVSFLYFSRYETTFNAKKM